MNWMSPLASCICTLNFCAKVWRASNASIWCGLRISFGEWVLNPEKEPLENCKQILAGSVGVSARR
jgi:hypothetical protein